MNLGDYIKQKRLEKGYSQRQLALYSGVNNATINRIEFNLGNPDTDTLNKLAKTLNIDASYLFYLTTGTNAPKFKDVPEEFILMARKTDKIPKETRKQIYNILDQTIDLYLQHIDKEKGDGDDE